MAMTLAAAAAATGLNKSTLLRAIQKGKISASKDALRKWQIEPVELHRVYPPAAQRGGNDAPQRDATAAILEAEVTALRTMADLLRDHLADMREDRDKWRTQAEVAVRALPAPAASLVASRRWWKRAS